MGASRLHRAYQKAVEAGLIKAQVPVQLGRIHESLVEAAILVEEIYAVEQSASSMVISTSLKLAPLLTANKPEHKVFLEPFLSGNGDHWKAMYCPNSSVMNCAEKGVAGLLMTAATQEGDDWVRNEEKVRLLYLPLNL